MPPGLPSREVLEIRGCGFGRMVPDECDEVGISGPSGEGRFMATV
jgi:hypothetical protein